MIALALSLMLGACGPGLKKLTEKDAGRTIELGVGEKLQVVLVGNPTTGYDWEVETVDETVLRPAGEPEFKPDSEAVGSGGKITLSFEAVAPGQTSLQLIYHRPWEEDVPPEKTFEVTVAVK